MKYVAWRSHFWSVVHNLRTSFTDQRYDNQTTKIDHKYQKDINR